jgi:hypothetical protein
MNEKGLIAKFTRCEPVYHRKLRNKVAANKSWFAVFADIAASTYLTTLFIYQTFYDQEFLAC